jgi:hypothetical protein
MAGVTEGIEGFRGIVGREYVMPHDIRFVLPDVNLGGSSQFRDRTIILAMFEVQLIRNNTPQAMFRSCPNRVHRRFTTGNDDNTGCFSYHTR